MRLRAFLVIILLLVGRTYAQTGKARASRAPTDATPAATAAATPPPPPPPGPPPPIPPPDYIDDDNEFDEEDDLPENAGYPVQPPTPSATPTQAPSSGGRALPTPAHETASSKPSAGAIHFRVVQGDFWEKGKKRERGHLDQ